jgi:hypothetical protein
MWGTVRWLEEGLFQKAGEQSFTRLLAGINSSRLHLLEMAIQSWRQWAGLGPAPRVVSWSAAVGSVHKMSRASEE